MSSCQSECYTRKRVIIALQIHYMQFMYTYFGDITCIWNQYPDLEEAKHEKPLTIMSAV